MNPISTGCVVMFALLSASAILSGTSYAPTYPTAVPRDILEGQGDPCKCKVIAKRKFQSEVCDCEDPVLGDEVPAFSVSHAVYPEGDPKSGACIDNGCTGHEGMKKDCEYKPIQITLTVANCARDCTGHGHAIPSVPFKSEATTHYPAGTGKSGAYAFGSNNTITSSLPSGGNNQCGMTGMKETYTIFNSGGSTAFTFWFEYGCEKCKALTDAGG